MRTKFSINRVVFNHGDSLDDCYRIYDEYYKPKGWLLDKECEDVYMFIDKEIQVNEGDRIAIGTIWIVDWKCVDILEGVVEYGLLEE